MYDHYLPELARRYFSSKPQERKPVRMFEIGLGCGMSAGPGNSVKLWKGYFKAMGVPLQLYVFEYNEKCGRKWLAKQNAETLREFEMYFGDQANEDDLNKAVVASGGMFDAIVDDGGHRCVRALSLRRP